MDEPHAPKLPVGLFAGLGALGIGLFLIGAAFMFTGGGLGFFCVLAGVGGLIGVQLVLAKVFGLPVRGPSGPMGAPPEE